MSSYTVRRGDSLLKVAHEFHTTVAVLTELNHIKNPNDIDVGEVLKLPDTYKPAAKKAPATSVPSQNLSRGAQSSAVKLLQADLVKLHDMTSAAEATGPGIFGRRTEAAVELFQRHAKISVTGKYDAATRSALEKALAKLPAKSTPAPTKKAPTTPSSLEVPSGTSAAYSFFSSFVKNQKGTFYTAKGQMNLIGFRKNNRVGSGSGSYSDVLYAVWKDSHGTPHVKSFKYNTEPAASMTWDSDDANHDGKPDPGRIPTGFYKYQVSSRSNGAPCLRSESDFKCERDINHDGSFSEHYEVSGGDVMLFHQGGYNGTGSAGCQTFNPNVWTSFWNTVKSAHGSIGYTLTRDIPSNV